MRMKSRTPRAGSPRTIRTVSGAFVRSLIITGTTLHWFSQTTKYRIFWQFFCTTSKIWSILNSYASQFSCIFIPPRCYFHTLVLSLFYLCVCLFDCLLSASLFVCLLVFVSRCLFVWVSRCLFVWVTHCLFVWVYLYLFVCISHCLCLFFAVLTYLHFSLFLECRIRSISTRIRNSAYLGSWFAVISVWTGSTASVSASPRPRAR